MKPTSTQANQLAWLTNLQSWHLKRLAFLTGVTSTGSKAEIRGVLTRSLTKHRLPYPKARILSVDMGVKNLAFCLLEVNQNHWHTGSSNDHPGLGHTEMPLHLSEWKRLDISNRLMRPALENIDRIGVSRVQDEVQEGSVHSDQSDAELLASDQSNMYSPSQLSKVAYSLAAEFVKHEPDVILIERQRFRSGGAPAIQEWTVRVNMLESMLWASLEAMRHGHRGIEVAGFPEVIEINPRRIGSFWLAEGREGRITPADLSVQMEGTKKKEDTATSLKAKRSLEKKDKIALAGSWLQLDSQLAHDPKLNHLASLMRPLTGTSSSLATRKRKGSLIGTHSYEKSVSTAELSDTAQRLEVLTKPGKLDDLADCLVQGVTFALWEENRRRVLDYGHRQG